MEVSPTIPCFYRRSHNLNPSPTLQLLKSCRSMPAYPESLGLEIELHGGRRLAALSQLQVQQPIAAHRRGQPGNVIAAGTYLLRFRRRRTAVAMRWHRESNSVDVRA